MAVQFRGAKKTELHALHAELELVGFRTGPYSIMYMTLTNYVRITHRKKLLGL
jgi:hypothetical protein